jgi:hypothetical protein
VTPVQDRYASILKVAPDGVQSVLAGSQESVTRPMADGTGSAARFLFPRSAAALMCQAQ